MELESTLCHALFAVNAVREERVGGLLVDAINLQSSRDAAAVWAYDLVMREDVTEGFRDLVVAALQMDAVVEEAQQLAVQVVNRVLSDEGTILEAKKVLRDALEDQELRNSAKESLWSIVIPWGSRSSPDEVKRAVRLAEELASLPALNDDERASLRSLQMRLRAEGRKGARAEKRTEPASEAPPQAASGVSQAKEASQVPEETKEKQARPLELTTQPLKALKAPEAPSGEDTSPKASEKDRRTGQLTLLCQHGMKPVTLRAMLAERNDDDFDMLERRFEQKYEVTEPKVLGEGTYGKVYKAVSRISNQVVAIKRIKLNPDDDEGVPSTALREVAVLKELDSEYVVKLFEVFCSPSKLVLVFELMENDLRKYMKQVGGKIPSHHVKSLCWQMVKGLEICHANRIIHRDIKPQNLLIDANHRLKLADFGLARAFMVPIPKYTHEVVTVWYRAPEILLGSGAYSIAVDMWAVGCVFAEMATGGPLFQGDSEIDTIFKIFQKLGTPNEMTWPGVQDLPNFKPSFPQWRHKGWANIRQGKTKEKVGECGIDLLEKFLAYAPKQRLSARKGLQHPYLADAGP
ncbi:CDK3 [Symbiodinium sp. KB8]|nr:CDK3 [Symbiodinium sp. KB8]